MTRYTFRKHEHLCGRLRIQEVFSTGKAVNEGSFRLVGKVMELPTVARAQVAFSVPRRYLRHAVDRNRMKRLMREVYRLNKAGYLDRLAAADRRSAWLFVYQGRGTVDLAETRIKITRCLDRWMDKHGF